MVSFSRYLTPPRYLDKLVAKVYGGFARITLGKKQTKKEKTR